MKITLNNKSVVQEQGYLKRLVNFGKRSAYYATARYSEIYGTDISQYPSYISRKSEDGSFSHLADFLSFSRTKINTLKGIRAISFLLFPAMFGAYMSSYDGNHWTTSTTLSLAVFLVNGLVFRGANLKLKETREIFYSTMEPVVKDSVSSRNHNQLSTLQPYWWNIMTHSL